MIMKVRENETGNWLIKRETNDGRVIEKERKRMIKRINEWKR